MRLWVPHSSANLSTAVMAPLFLVILKDLFSLSELWNYFLVLQLCLSCSSPSRCCLLSNPLACWPAKTCCEFCLFYLSVYFEEKFESAYYLLIDMFTPYTSRLIMNFWHFSFRCHYVKPLDILWLTYHLPLLLCLSRTRLKV